jgi:subfamily B ATP-binding cassette protein HlyB/CyaB
MAVKFPHSTIQCLAAIAQHHRLQVNPERLIEDYALVAREPPTATVLRIAADIGLKARADTLTWAGLLAQEGVFPLIARLADGNSVIVMGVSRQEGDGQIAILNPLADNASAVIMIDRDKFCAKWEGAVFLMKRLHAAPEGARPFGFRWFIPEILKQKAALRDIAIAAIAMHLLALASPIFFQLVIDKVLVHQSVGTLWVLGVGIVVALVFDALFGFLRQILTLSATNKIDMRLTRRTFSHLLSLPIDYFETTTAGVITRHMQQVEKIRSFLTGRMFFTALDATSLLLFLPILFTYSVQLAMVVLLFTLLIALVVMGMVPTFQRRLNDLYAAEAERQSMMVETIHGMRTVKALAIEPAQRRLWDQRSAQSINMHYRVGKISITGNAITDFLGKLLPVVIIVLGAQQVFRPDAVGRCADRLPDAFGPRGRSRWSQIVSPGATTTRRRRCPCSMLGEVMNRPPEGRAGAGGLRPPLKPARSRFDERSPSATPAPAWHGARPRRPSPIPAGAVVGIVGRSGSGKTTLTQA